MAPPPTLCGPMAPWAIGHRRPGPPSRWTKGQSCNNSQTGQHESGRSNHRNLGSDWSGTAGRSAAFDIRLNVARRDLANIVAKGRKLPHPVLAGPTCLHPAKTRRQVLEESQKLRAPDRPIREDLSGLGNPMDLENVLGQICANCCNLHWVAFLAAVTTTALWRIATPVGAGAIHPIGFGDGCTAAQNSACCVCQPHHHSRHPFWPIFASAIDVSDGVGSG